MRHLAAAILTAFVLEDRATVERRRADALRELHRRPDALPDPVEPVRPSRRSLVSGAVVRRRRPAAEGG